MEHTLISLPYPKNALEPFMSAETLEYHHGKHHGGYVKKLNALIKGTEFETMRLEDIILHADGAIFNNAAQVFNHNAFFSGLTRAETSPSVELSDLIETKFGSMERFKETFMEMATALFGSGWVWLSIDKRKELHLNKTCNANTPLRYGRFPLMTCDIWEHAYYIDYRNDRASYLKQWWELINWNYVSENLAASMHTESQNYLQACPEPTMMCDYLDELQDSERTGS